MRRVPYCVVLLAALLVGNAQAKSSDIVKHELAVRLEPASGELSVEDRLLLPAAWTKKGKALEFTLHADLTPLTLTPGASVKRVQSNGMRERFRLVLAPGELSVILRYQGRIRHALRRVAEGIGRHENHTPGTISPEGVILSRSAAWYPVFGDERLIFALTADLPAGWMAVSQGQRQVTPRGHRVLVHWAETQPQDDIYLIAGHFHEYRRATPHAEAFVFLRHPDAELAKTYLLATERYLALYSRLLGPYPYVKFALVENFWESGYGMPSFTLLGPRVIRLPFIPRTSYPHEILHNWWGNSVYVDPEQGNWSEGLTTYLADHLLAEERGEGADYRRRVLQKYADYVRSEDDFPLSSFVARENQATQAVGYGKNLMLFHMLRRELGDETFANGLRRFYRDHRFRFAGYHELRQAFEVASGRTFGHFMSQWVERPGAPSLKLHDVRTDKTGTGHRLSFTLEQTQPGTAYKVRVPIAVSLAGRAQTHQSDVVMLERRLAVELPLPARPLRLDVDPEFDVFRRVDRQELPPALDELFAAKEVTVVLPAAAPKPLADAYRHLAEAWRTDAPSMDLRRDDEVEHLPEGRAVWLFGWNNRLRPALGAALSGYPVMLGDDDLYIENRLLSRTEHTLALAARDPRGQPLAWLGAHDPDMVIKLVGRLPRYGRYSYVAFTPGLATAAAKGYWPVTDSPLSAALSELKAPSPVLAPRRALSHLAR